jgi:rSAM/selenodomain-associated transferase 2
VKISVVVPVLNEEGGVLLEALSRACSADEVIVVDGGSTDGTLQKLASLPVQLAKSTAGRASQMNAGASQATGDILVFLHADVLLPADWVQQILSAYEANKRYAWGRFDVEFYSTLTSNHHDKFLMRIIAWFMNMRSRLSGISTGDQCQFFHRDVFFGVGKFPDQKLMEDIEISARALSISSPVNLKSSVRVSDRRWKVYGAYKTMLLMWSLRWQYWRGKSTDALHRSYYGSDR